MISTEQVTSVVVGKTVELLCFAQFTIYIHLEGNVLLTVEGGLEHIHAQTREAYSGESPIVHSGLMTILEGVVNSASIEENGNLSLAFSNGDSITVHKRVGYESYRLSVEGKELFA